MPNNFLNLVAGPPSNQQQLPAHANEDILALIIKLVVLVELKLILPVVRQHLFQHLLLVLQHAHVVEYLAVLHLNGDWGCGCGSLLARKQVQVPRVWGGARILVKGPLHRAESVLLGFQILLRHMVCLKVRAHRHSDAFPKCINTFVEFFVLGIRQCRVLRNNPFHRLKSFKPASQGAKYLSYLHRNVTVEAKTVVSLCRCCGHECLIDCIRLSDAVRAKHGDRHRVLARELPELLLPLMDLG
mmetsp:Transcript_48803/g.121899  ORF Transcript_48803/g.121899 Transcript_48803/m.121899 type:complete len:243 (-) Transcript_48803:2106-2834(-)